MNMEALRNVIRAEIERALSRRTRETAGVVDAYDPATHAIKVKLQPEGVVTGWIPLRQGQAGNGYGMHLAPQVNDHAAIAFHEDDRSAATVVGMFFNDISKPVSVQAGEYKYVSPFGSGFFYFKNDQTITWQDASNASFVFDHGKITLKDKAGSTIVMDGQGHITLTDKAGNKIDMNGTDTITATAAKIVLAGQVFLGSASASRPLSAQGTVDTHGDTDASNFLTQVLGQ